MGMAQHVLADPPAYVTWGWASVSLPNLIVILVTIALLVLAVLLPFPKDRRGTGKKR